MTSPALAGVPSLKVPKENNRYLCFPKASDSKQLIDRNRLILLDRGWISPKLQRLGRLSILEMLQLQSNVCYMHFQLSEAM